MYKILYLPSAEEVQLANAWENPITLIGKAYLCCPKGFELRDKTFLFRTALIHSKQRAKSLIDELVFRESCKEYHLIREYFEIIEIE